MSKVSKDAKAGIFWYHQDSQKFFGVLSHFVWVHLEDPNHKNRISWGDAYQLWDDYKNSLRPKPIPDRFNTDLPFNNNFAINELHNSFIKLEIEQIFTISMTFVNMLLFMSIFFKFS
jgi:hypothetical protein